MQPVKDSSAARYALALITALIAAAPTVRASYTFTNFSVPGAIGSQIQGISGNTIYGDYFDANQAEHGFVMSNGQLTTFDAPLAGAGYREGTMVSGISGSEVVGTVNDTNKVNHGFIESGGAYSIYDAPASSETFILGIDGQNIVGSYLVPPTSRVYGFIYSGSGFTQISDPLIPAFAPITWGFAISGSTVAGDYIDEREVARGFVFNGRTYTTIDDPLAGTDGSVLAGTIIRAIDGSRLLGDYVDNNGVEHGFIYDGSTFETVDFPSYDTTLTGEFGNTVVGYYYDPNANVFQSFIGTTPEPTATAVLLLGGSLLALGRRRSRR